MRGRKLGWMLGLSGGAHDCRHREALRLCCEQAVSGCRDSQELAQRGCPDYERRKRQPPADALPCPQAESIRTKSTGEPILTPVERSRAALDAAIRSALSRLVGLLVVLLILAVLLLAAMWRLETWR